MDTATVLDLVKERLGIRTDVRDAYLISIIEGVIDELQTSQGLVLDGTSPFHLMFVVDYATWRYQSRDESGAMPRHLQWRLHNLIIGGGQDEL